MWCATRRCRSCWSARKFRAWHMKRRTRETKTLCLYSVERRVFFELGQSQCCCAILSHQTRRACSTTSTEEVCYVQENSGSARWFRDIGSGTAARRRAGELHGRAGGPAARSDPAHV